MTKKLPRDGIMTGKEVAEKVRASVDALNEAIKVATEAGFQVDLYDSAEPAKFYPLAYAFQIIVKL